MSRKNKALSALLVGAFITLGATACTDSNSVSTISPASEKTSASSTDKSQTTAQKDEQPSKEKAFLSAAESDPVKLGWMQGFPPAEDKILSVREGTFFNFPAMRYSVAHMRQFFPTVSVSRNLNSSAALPSALDESIDAITFQPSGPIFNPSTGSNDKTVEIMTWKESLDQNYTDGLLILHKGNVVYERYSGALQAEGKHAAMSVTKSFTGTLASILVAEGTL